MTIRPHKYWIPIGFGDHFQKRCGEVGQLAWPECDDVTKASQRFLVFGQTKSTVWLRISTYFLCWLWLFHVILMLLNVIFTFFYICLALFLPLFLDLCEICIASQAGALGRRRIPSSMSAAAPASMSASPAEFEIGGAGGTSPCRPLRWSDLMMFLDTASLTANSRFWIACVCFGILTYFACVQYVQIAATLNLHWISCESSKSYSFTPTADWVWDGSKREGCPDAMRHPIIPGIWVWINTYRYHF